uniref:DUF6598 domain-containing protein n=1 Tax=Arundo donax TaxID=35708 RepID=A0A0A9CPG9_ARUDO
MPISLSGVIGLSRRVVSVELSGELEVDVVASQIGGKNVVAKGQVIFTPKEAGMSVDTCDLGFCKLGITVAWSLLAPMELDRSV